VRTTCPRHFSASRSAAEHSLFRAKRPFARKPTEDLTDYLLPVSSPENTLRISKQPKENPLEGFPLLHLSKYAGDPAAIDWPRWVQRYGYRKAASDRGLRYSRLVHALEAVRSNAGQLLCGLALLLDEVESGVLSIPFPVSQGAWTQHAYQMSLRRHAARRSAVQQFRAWVMQEGARTAARMAAFTSTPASPPES